QAVLNFSGYLKVVANSLGSTCTANIRQAFTEFTQLLKSSEGKHQLNKIFHLCDPLDGANEKDVANLMHHFAGQISIVVQYNGESANQMNIPQLCTVMANASLGSPVQRFASITNKKHQGGCLVYKYANSVSSLVYDKWWDHD